jgi:Leucine-rich repeat (LRR) protein
MYLNGAPHHRHARLTVTGVDKLKNLQLLSIRNLGWLVLRIASGKMCIFIENVNMGELFNGSQVEFNASLQRVEISNTPNLLTTLPAWIGNCSRLEYLTVENSSLSSLVHMNGATQLLHAKLSMNNFMNLSTQLNLPNLQTLDLSRNNIHFIDKIVFANLPALNTLDLSDNILTKLHPVRYVFSRNDAP